MRAEDVILCRRRPEGLSVRNAIPGRIFDQSQAGTTHLVYVDVGVRMAVKITPESAAEMGLVVGEEVVCLVKTHSIRIGPEVD